MTEGSLRALFEAEVRALDLADSELVAHLSRAPLDGVGVIRAALEFATQEPAAEERRLRQEALDRQGRALELRARAQQDRDTIASLSTRELLLRAVRR